jgi:hypothetical protein
MLTAPYSLEMLQNHNIVMKNPSMKRYVWHIYTNFPFPAHVYLLCALRYRTSDEFADRAWEQLSISAETRMKHNERHVFAKKQDSYIHLAFGNLTVKAWEAREAAFQSVAQPAPVTPHFVSQYRKQLAEKRSRSRSATNDPSPTAQPEKILGGQFTSQFPMLDPNSLAMGPAFDQSMLPGMFPTDSTSTGWEFWNDMIQGGDSMQGIDAIPPPYNYYQN